MTLLLPPPLSPLLFQLLLLPLQDSESPKCLPKIPIYYLYKYWTRRNNYVTLFAKSFWNLVFAAFCTQNVLGEPPHDSFICTTTTTAVGTVSAAAEKKRREWENKLLLAGLLVSAIFFPPPPHFRRRQFGKRRRVARYYAAGGGNRHSTARRMLFLILPKSIGDQVWRVV